MFVKLRAFADIGRTQGITTTALIAIVGALTSTMPFEWYYILYFTVFAVIAHMTLNTYIALGDIHLDARTYVPSRNPVTSGVLTNKEAMIFIYTGALSCLVLILILVFFIELHFMLLALFCFVIAYGSLLWYGWRGKKVLFSYDFTFSVSYSFTVLFGVYAIGGLPTIYTWIFIGVVIFAATAFAQWENGLKDVDADRSVGVRSFAVYTNVKNNEKLFATHPYFIYGCLLKAGFLFFMFITFWYTQDLYYLLFLLIYGIPSQVYIMYRFVTKQQAVEHRKTILLDVTFSAILASSVLFTKTGIVPILLLILYLIGGYLIGSLVQSNCEFKFRRFSTPR